MYMAVSALVPAAPIGRRLQLLSLGLLEQMQNPLVQNHHAIELCAQLRAKDSIPLLATWLAKKVICGYHLIKCCKLRLVSPVN